MKRWMLTVATAVMVTRAHAGADLTAWPAVFDVTNQMGAQVTRDLVVTVPAGMASNVTLTMIGCETNRTPARARGAVVSPATAARRGVQPIAAGARYAPHQLLVRFAPAADTRSRNSVLARIPGAHTLGEVANVPGLVQLALPTDTSVAAALAALADAPDVLYAEPNYIVTIAERVPNDTLFTNLWAMRNQGQTGGTPGADIHATHAWEFTTGSRAIIAAVVDTGIEYTHEDLQSNMWRNTLETPGNGLDDDGNGVVDDVHGCTIVNDTVNGNPADVQGHGTHVAGTIGAVANNGRGVAGVCWQVQLMACRFMTAAGEGAVADAARCLAYATAMGADVVNASWGGGAYSQALKDAIEAAGAAGVLFVCAAGNDGMDISDMAFYPPAYGCSNMLVIMATDSSDARASFSNYGHDVVDLAAPGVNILSCQKGGGYVAYNGTSMATPHVAGACALLRALNPTMSITALRDAVCDAVDPVPALADACRAGGRLNLARAALQAGAAWINIAPPVVSNVAPGSSVTAMVILAAGRLPAGRYSGGVTIACNAPDVAAVQVPAGMTVLADALVMTPDAAFITAGIRGGPYTPSAGIYVLSNRGASVCAWTAQASAAWLSASPAAGALEPAAACTITAAHTAAALSLPAGTYATFVVVSNAGKGAAQWRDAALDVRLPPRMPIYSFDLASDPGWPRQGLWQFGKPQGIDGDPTTGHTGTNVFGYNLAGAYTTNAPAYYLTTPALDFSRHEHITLNFWRWLRTSLGYWSEASIEVSTNGTTWLPIWEHRETLGYIVDFAWRPLTYDLSRIADRQPTVYVRWGMGPTAADDATRGGWNLDDISFGGVLADSLVVGPVDPFAIEGYASDVLSPTAMCYQLSNAGSTTLAWQVNTPVDWLQIAPAVGSVAPAEAAAVTVMLTAQAYARAPGMYATTLTFSNLMTGLVQTRPVTLRIRAMPGDLLLLDSVAPTADAQLHFGSALVGATRTEMITITNCDVAHTLTLYDLSFSDWYREDFSDGLAQGWVETTDDQWHVVSNRYRAKAYNYGRYMQSLYLGDSWQDCAVQVGVQREGSFGSASMIFVRASDNFSLQYGRGSAYAVSIKGETLHVARWQNGAYTYLTGGEIVSPYLNPNEMHNVVQLDVRGSNLTVSLNGHIAWAGADSAIPGPGRIGLFGYSGYNVMTYHYFDHISVQRPTVPGDAPVTRMGWTSRPPFALSGVPGMPHVIAPGAALALSATFTPATFGAFTNVLLLDSDDTNEPAVTCVLTGIGLDGGPTIGATALIYPTAGALLEGGAGTSIVWRASAISDGMDGTTVTVSRISIHTGAATALVADVAYDVPNVQGSAAWFVPDSLLSATTAYVVRLAVADSSGNTNERVFTQQPFYVVPEVTTPGVLLAALLAGRRRRSSRNSHIS